jgi:hypothetical protein
MLNPPSSMAGPRAAPAAPLFGAAVDVSCRHIESAIELTRSSQCPGQSLVTIGAGQVPVGPGPLEAPSEVAEEPGHGALGFPHVAAPRLPCDELLGPHAIVGLAEDASEAADISSIDSDEQRRPADVSEHGRARGRQWSAIL